ncbi:CLUMA_CG000336, isoform A [Clunio marinus]|uniref:CLUMA_CG000336, isoform A n=1 Tax=Clunio marinus TaxID=568069 RepID=A0A1J1HG31_9DIPT|nr:CLUMA_CG000336, isoform A [Clunio marinus]
MLLTMPLRYARLEKADILEMVVKHLKDIKKRRQAMITAMEPILFRSFKMGFMDCTRVTIDFIKEMEVETPGSKKQEIIDHITKECVKTFQNHSPPAEFRKHHENAFANVNPSDQFFPFSLMSTSFDSDMEWPSLEERLGFSPIEKTSFLLPDIKPLPELMTSSFQKSEDRRVSAFNIILTNAL